MIQTSIIFIVLLMAVAIVLRIKAAARRRNELIKSLLDTMTEPAVTSPRGAMRHELVAISEHLVRYFSQSTASRGVLSVLAGTTDPLADHEVVDAVAKLRRAQRKRELPPVAIMNAAKILRGAGLAEYNGDKLQITDAGRTLNQLLAQPSGSGLFARPFSAARNFAHAAGK